MAVLRTGAAAQGGIIIAGTTVMVVIINEFLNPRRIHFLFSMVSERNTGELHLLYSRVII
jgi:hypothetical protein